MSTGQTSVDGIFVAGDVSGIEEASSAMIEGRISGVVIANSLGYLTEEEKDNKIEQLEHALGSLRKGMFAPGSRGKKIVKTDEGIDISRSLLKKGYLSEDEIESFPRSETDIWNPSRYRMFSEYPCNPCQDVCPKGCIEIGDDITSLPVVGQDSECIGCGLCVAACPGQAIFLVDEEFEEGFASITIPYELLPLPEKGDKGKALDRSGSLFVMRKWWSQKSSNFDKTHLLTMKVPADKVMSARFFKSVAGVQK